MSVADAAGERIAEAERSFDFARRTAINQAFIVNEAAQGKGIARTHISSLLLDFYLPAGVTRVAVSAGLDAGGYVWAKAGFAPTEESWKKLRLELMDRMRLMRIDDPFLLAAALDDDPRSIWDVADHAAGKRLLSGSRWRGSIDLTDAEMLERLKDFGRRKP